MCCTWHSCAGWKVNIASDQVATCVQTLAFAAGSEADLPLLHRVLVPSKHPTRDRLGRKLLCRLPSISRLRNRNASYDRLIRIEMHFDNKTELERTTKYSYGSWTTARPPGTVDSLRFVGTHLLDVVNSNLAA